MQCEYQATAKSDLEKHKKSVHKGVRYPCGQCEYQATTKGNLDQHKRSIHEGIRYPCRKCLYQATTKSQLEQHRRSIHEGTFILVGKVSIKQQQREVQISIEGQFMKECNIHPDNLNNKKSLSQTNKQFMKG